MKVICIGSAAYDITIPVSEYPVENSKNRVSKRIECGGGPSSNAAYLLGKWGIESYFSGVLGNDEFGKKIIEEFESVNVNLDYMQLDSNSRTTASFIIANKSNGSRTVLSYREKRMELRDIDLKIEPDVILVDGQEYEVSKQVIENSNAISVIDAGRPTDEIIELCKIVDYVVCSREFAEAVTGITVDYKRMSTLKNLYIEMKRKFKGNVVVTLEEKGSLYKDGRDLKIMPSLKVKAIDSTGAGDIFHAAFVYGLAKNWNINRICKTSNIAGALSVTRLGGRNSVFSKEEIKAIYHEFE